VSRLRDFHDKGWRSAFRPMSRAEARPAGPRVILGHCLADREAQRLIGPRQVGSG